MLVKSEENTVGFDEVPGGFFSHYKPLLGFVITCVGYKLCKMHQMAPKTFGLYCFYENTVGFDELPSGNLFPLVN